MAPPKGSSSSSSEGDLFDLPRLRVSFGLETDTRYLKAQEDSVAEFFDIKFCPYQPLNQDPVFAAISKKHIVICKLSKEKDNPNPCEIIYVIRDDDDDAVNCCCTWSKDTESGRPLLCVAGKDAKVKIYDISAGKVACCLAGHGREINDMATSPMEPWIIATASDDATVRLWSLAPSHSKQPCLALLGGEAHCAGLLSVAFHDTGRYLLSAGHDGVVNLWTLPDFPEEASLRPMEIHYSHFSSSEVHSSLIDCVAFYGDMILSRACHDEVIVLWAVEGFSSSNPPPPPSAAPTPFDPVRLTRSAFTPSTSGARPVLYTRILQFETPGCGPQFFMRFRLYSVPGQNPVLAFCNASGKLFFWDLERLLVYHRFWESTTNSRRSGAPAPVRPSWLQLAHPRKAAVSDSSNKSKDTNRQSETRAGTEKSTRSAGTGGGPSTSGSGSGSGSGLKEPLYNSDTITGWESKYSIDSPFRPLKAHKTESFGIASFVGRQVGWSPGGEWCVVVGSCNLAMILQRWGKR